MYLKALCSLLFCLVAIQNAWTQKVFFSGNDDNAIYICEDGRIFMSGENNTGQLGRGDFVPSNVPVPIAGIDGVGSAPRCKQVQIEGVSTFLALTNSGDTLIAWGPNEFGQVGDGTIGSKTYPVIVKGVGGIGRLENIKQIATGNYTSYALTEDGKVLSWGSNSFGQIGSGNLTSPVLFPTYVLKAPGDTLKNVKRISGGGVFALALLCDGTVWGWGRNNLGQLGQGTIINSEYAVPVKNRFGTAPLQDIVMIEAGDNYSFGLSSKDTLWCWGPNWDGRLGTGNFTEQLLPTYVRNAAGNGQLSGVLDIAAGQGHAITLLSDQSVYAWGINGRGQLGRNDTINSNLPVRVKDPSGTGFLSNVNYITTGDEFSIVRTDANELYVWGGNPLGQLGVNDHVNRLLPVLLTLPCEPTYDVFPGYGKMEHASSACLGANSGTVFLTKHHSSIVRWEQSFNNFSSVTNLNNTGNSQPYANLTQSTSFRAVLKECSTTFNSLIATIQMDSSTTPGAVQSSAAVRINSNHDTLQLTQYKGSVLRWESSHDNFVSDITPLSSTADWLEYSGISRTTYYRALVQRGACPARYSDTAVIRTIDQEMVKIYNGFTPDADDVNDEWIIDFIELYPQNKVEIYNRWGQVVYRASSYDNKKNVWKGENNVSDKQVLADGTYFYVVDLGEDLPVLKGYVVISR